MFSLKNFFDVNGKSDTNEQGYLFHILMYDEIGSKIHQDFLVSLVNLMSPTIINRNNMLFIEQCFTAQRLNDMIKNGDSADDIQYWMNLVEITEIFREMDWDLVTMVADKIFKSWQGVIATQYAHENLVVKKITDNDLDEIFLLICKADNSVLLKTN